LEFFLGRFLFLCNRPWVVDTRQISGVNTIIIWYSNWKKISTNYICGMFDTTRKYGWSRAQVIHLIVLIVHDCQSFRCNCKVWGLSVRFQISWVNCGVANRIVTYDFEVVFWPSVVKTPDGRRQVAVGSNLKWQEFTWKLWVLWDLQLRSTCGSWRTRQVGHLQVCTNGVNYFLMSLPKLGAVQHMPWLITSTLSVNARLHQLST